MTQAAARAAVVGSSTSRSTRARLVEDAVHSLRVEGLDVTEEAAADAVAYVEGQIDIDEVGRRTRARYGVPEERAAAQA